MLYFETDSHPDSLGHARRRVRDTIILAGIDREVVADVEVAVGEALANVHRQAGPASVGSLSVEVNLAPNELTVVILERGEATAVPVVPETRPPESDVNGRGLYVASRLVDGIGVTRIPNGGGTTITIKKALTNRTRPASGNHAGERPGKCQHGAH
jgi:anti-sigma regulatory factor (Ser/Thr protein kinase)